MRVLLKLSGEALTVSGQKGFKRDPVERIIAQIHSVWPEHQVAVSIGGGNICRGSELMREMAFPPEAAVDCDQVGMIATYVNGGALTLSMRMAGIDTRLMLAKPFGDLGEVFYHDVAKSHLAKGRLIVLAGGTGRPRFSTDTGAVLSACEVQADLVLKGTKVDGVYDRDPVKHQEAVRIPHISYDEFITRKLGIMDTTAVAMARDNHIPIRVFNIFEPGSLARALRGEGTYSEISA